MEFAQLQKDMIAAMKARDKERKEVIGTLVSGAKKIAIDEGHRDDIDEALVNRVIVKEIKTVQEQIDTCPDTRMDLKNQYLFKMSVLNEYAPKLMSEEEIRKELNEKYAELVASKNKGAIMKAVMADLKGKADGKVISKVVADLCK